MSDANKRIESTLPEDEVVTRWLFAHQLETKEQNKLIGALFRRAVDKWGKQAAYAMMIGVPPQHLTQMFAGDRAIYLRHVLPLLTNREALLELIGPLLAAIGMTAVMRPKMKRRDAEREIAKLVRRNTFVWKALKAELGRDAEEVESAFDAEPTRPGEQTG